VVSWVSCYDIGLFKTEASVQPFFANKTWHFVGLPEDNVNPYDVLAQRTAAWFTSAANLCCNTASCNGEPYCRRSCPASCSWQGWNGNPSYSLLSFTIDDPNPQSYSIAMVQSKNSTNYTKNTTYDAFTYTENWTDTVTVSQTTTFTEGVDIQVSVDFAIAKTSTTFKFSYSTSQTKSTTTTDSKTWSSTTSGIVVPACGGTYTQCAISVGNYNPTFTAVYEVNGAWNNIQCAGNFHYTSPSSTSEMLSYPAWAACSKCEPNCPSTTSMPNTIKVTGTVVGVLGNAVQCSYKSYTLPANQCN